MNCNLQYVGMQINPSPSFTESTLLDLVTADGRSGFMVRIARHVDEGRAWVWLVAFSPHGVFGFAEDRLSCSHDRTTDDGSMATYEAQFGLERGIEAVLSRRGSSLVPVGGACVVDVRGHGVPDIPRGPGADRIRLEATFEIRGQRAGSNLPGRTESIAEVDARLSVAGQTFSLSGLGQFHEQLQDAPRFDTPFTYLSLRGQHLSMIGLRGPRAGGAVLITDSKTEARQGLDVEPIDLENVMKTRKFRVGSLGNLAPSVSGTAEPTLFYSIPIGTGRRPSLIVRGEIEGHSVSGFINDWVPRSS